MTKKPSFSFFYLRGCGVAPLSVVQDFNFSGTGSLLRVLIRVLNDQIHWREFKEAGLGVEKEHCVNYSDSIPELTLLTVHKMY